MKIITLMICQILLLYGSLQSIFNAADWNSNSVHYYKSLGLAYNLNISKDEVRKAYISQVKAVKSDDTKLREVNDARDKILEYIESRDGGYQRPQQDKDSEDADQWWLGIDSKSLKSGIVNYFKPISDAQTIYSDQAFNDILRLNQDASDSFRTLSFSVQQKVKDKVKEFIDGIRKDKVAVDKQERIVHWIDDNREALVRDIRAYLLQNLDMLNNPLNEDSLITYLFNFGEIDIISRVEEEEGLVLDDLIPKICALAIPIQEEIRQEQIKKEQEAIKKVEASKLHPDALNMVNAALELASMLPKTNIGMISSAKNRKDDKIQQLWDLSPDMQIIRVPVLQQGFKDGWPKGKVFDTLSWDQIKSDDGANCGYHALKNAILLMNAFEKSDDLYLEYLKSKPIYFDFMSLWTPIIYDYREHTLPLNWLFGNEVELLAYRDLSRSSQKALAKKLGRAADLLKTKLLHLKQEFLTKNINIEQMIAIIEPLPQGAGEGFIDLNSMEAIVKDIIINHLQHGRVGVVWTEDRGGHWVSFVIIKRDGHIKIFYMNSAAGDYGLGSFVRFFNS